MGFVKFFALGAVCAILTACGSTDQVAMRNAPLDLGPGVEAGQTIQQRDYQIVDLNFVAPAELSVSERNGYYPMADIVWRGDRIGDRKTQIAELFRTAATRNMDADGLGRPVVVDVQLRRFHGVTERVRYSVGGVYNIVFDMTVRDATTGAVIEPARKVVANMPAPGGTAAIIAEQSGQTEKVRVTDFLTLVLSDELSGPVQTASR
ncbi:hypothetical protein SAMN05428995_103137 [Loktanella sp. DSM 29012]|uniref:DUF6778 family protein n=1 Tax=Loktanella sp. DSM 29012 TaxID=1881056 RepID=UPI0008C57CDF|nr:DUF6778 family protein [Loktanella sp. DSM 29012]SEQ18218.1 hypothetical protein SAMN05428995_103137 [Loktanella sp. DSM 29012]